jgi:hypothetical protein
MACGECKARGDSRGASGPASDIGSGKWICASSVTAGRQEQRQTASMGEDMVVYIGGGYNGRR